MRKIILAIFIISMFVCSANAQIKKGSIFLGGDIGGSTQKTKTDGVTSDKQSGINISPVIGKAIKENLVLGINAGVTIYHAENTTNTSSYSAGVFLRKYKNIGNGGFYIFVQGGLNGAYYKQKRNVAPSPISDETKIMFVGLTAYPGISYAISRKLHLEAGFNNLLLLNYSNEKRETGDPVISTKKTNAFNISSSLSNATSSLYLGFRLLIGK
jgi:hypothetical protein